MQNITRQSKSYASDKPARNGIIDSLWAAGRTFYKQQHFKHGLRDYAVKCVAHYLFYGDHDRRIPASGYGKEKQRYGWLLHWYEKAFSYYKGKAEHCARSVQWGRSERSPVERDRYIARQMQNDKSRRIAKQKIWAAVEQCKTEGVEATQTKIVRLSGCGSQTVKRHLTDIQKEVERISQGVITCSYGRKDKSCRLPKRSSTLLPTSTRNSVARPAITTPGTLTITGPASTTGSTSAASRWRPSGNRSTSSTKLPERLGRWWKVQKQFQEDYRHERRIITSWCGEIN